MSRKNRNGARRSYSPKTYGRDFLRPTPIERVIQEANRTPEPQSVSVSSRIVFPDSSYSSAMLTYRIIGQLRPGEALLGGFKYDCTLPTYGSMMLNGLVPSMGN